MTSLLILIPVSLLWLIIAIAALFWAVRSGQFEALDSAACAILSDDKDAPTIQNQDSESAALQRHASRTLSSAEARENQLHPSAAAEARDAD
jgi:cbb3-type cytochrome oxidase maturation protein